MYKQVILIRQDLQLPKGKAAAQAAHAAVDAVLKADKDVVRTWRVQGMMKICLKVSDEPTLFRFIQQAKDQGLVTAVITDAGKTVVAPGTVTCAAIGPSEEGDVDSITGDLQLF